MSVQVEEPVVVEALLPDVVGEWAYRRALCPGCVPGRIPGGVGGGPSGSAGGAGGGNSGRSRR